MAPWPETNSDVLWHLGVVTLFNKVLFWLLKHCLLSVISKKEMAFLHNSLSVTHLGSEICHSSHSSSEFLRLHQVGWRSIVNRNL